MMENLTIDARSRIEDESNKTSEWKVGRKSWLCTGNKFLEGVWLISTMTAAILTQTKVIYNCSQCNPTGLAAWQHATHSECEVS